LARCDHLPILVADAYRHALQVEQGRAIFKSTATLHRSGSAPQCRAMMRLIIRVNRQTERRGGLKELHTAVEELLVVGKGPATPYCVMALMQGSRLPQRIASPLAASVSRPS
jgi:hypothetical protein